MKTYFLVFTPEIVSASKEELTVMTVSEIVSELIKAHEEKKDVNLNR